MASFRLWSFIGFICLQASVHAQHLRVRNISYIQPFSAAQSDWYYMSDTLTHDASVAVITKNQKRLDLFFLTDSRDFQENLFQGNGSMKMYRVKPRDEKSFVILTQTCVMQLVVYPELRQRKRYGPCNELNATSLRYNNLANYLADVTGTTKFKELAVDVATRAIYFSLNDNTENIYHGADGTNVVTKLNKVSGRLFDVHNRILYTVTAFSEVNMFNRRTDSSQTLVNNSGAQSVDSGGYLRSIRLRNIEAIHYYRNGILFVRDREFIHCLDTGIQYGHQIKFFTTRDAETPKTGTPRSQISSGPGQSTRSLLAVSNSSRHIAVNGKSTAGYAITIEPIRKLSVKYDNASTISWSYDDPNSLLKVTIECPKPCPNREGKDEKRITDKGTGEQLDVYQKFGLKPRWNYTFVVTGVSSTSDYEIMPAKISEAYVAGLKVTGVRHNGSYVLFTLESQAGERRKDKFIVCLAGRCAGQKNIDRGRISPYGCGVECGPNEYAVDLLSSGELKDGETITIRVGIIGNLNSIVFTPPITVTIKGSVRISRNSVDLSIIDLYDLTLSYVFDTTGGAFYRPSYVRIRTVDVNLDQTFKLSTASTIRLELTLDKNADGYYIFLPQEKPTIDIIFLNSVMEKVETLRFTNASPSYQLIGKMRDSGWYTKDYVYHRRGIVNIVNSKLPVYLLIILIVAPVLIIAGIVVFILWKNGVIVPAQRRKHEGGGGGERNASSPKKSSKSKRKGKSAKIHVGRINIR